MNETVMNEDRFRAIIEQSLAHGGNQDRQLALLHQALQALSPDEIEAFQRAFQRQQQHAYSWDLIGAADILNGGVSDDGFEYFQRWLIAQGRAVFEAALADPDSLAGLETPWPTDFELFGTVAAQTWAEKTGIDPWTGSGRQVPLHRRAARRPADRPRARRGRRGHAQAVSEAGAEVPVLTAARAPN